MSCRDSARSSTASRTPAPRRRRSSAAPTDRNTIDRHNANTAGKQITRVAIAVLVLALAGLAAVALASQDRVVAEAKRADTANRLAAVYQDARFWVGQDESLERKYRIEPTLQTLNLHAKSGAKLTADLKSVAVIDGAPLLRRRIARLLQLHREYEAATARMFAATRSGETLLVKRLDHTVTDPISGEIQSDVYGAAAAASRTALRESGALHTDQVNAFRAGLLAVGLAVGLLALLSLVIRRYRRGEARGRAAELKRLSELAITDPLTGLRNHRAFHEDLAAELQRTARSRLPLTLVLLDVDDLKAVNDNRGHQVGDEHLRALASAITATMRGSDRAYRIGGDEFAVILPAVGEWAGFRYARRLEAKLLGLGGPAVRATAGIAEARELRPRDALIREADRALISAKRSGQAAALYTADMGDFADSTPDDEHQVRVLANALALAVDAKDPYTESHCQTVSNLCAAIGAEMGLDSERLSHLRLAGLLHDVGKIGIPDAILRKPAKLTAPEYELMKTHSALGESIVRAAEMPERARWVRHHHERIDGAGYPDGLAAGEIPLESRIIHVADAFEAMTSDRPYRKAPGEEFALAELTRNEGTQFDVDVVEALIRLLENSRTARVASGVSAIHDGTAVLSV